MLIFITGGTGFIGTHLSNFFLNQGHSVTALGVRARQKQIDHSNYRYISADTTQRGAWQEELSHTDTIINLAGTTIFKRWNARYKKLIYDSRILTTRNVVEALPGGSPVTLCSASAVGYYGNRGDDILTEDQPSGDGFLAEVGRDWEREALRAVQKGLRVTTMRFGIVLGKNGGAMEKMIPAFRSFIGGPLGNGRQWFPWMHIDDLVSAVLFIIENQKLEGPFNFCAPNPVRNQDLAKTMGKVLKRPSFMPAPGFMLRIVLGEVGSTLLESQRAIPDKLLKHGFKFKYPDLESAIQQIVAL